MLGIQAPNTVTRVAVVVAIYGLSCINHPSGYVFHFVDNVDCVPTVYSCCLTKEKKFCFRLYMHLGLPIGHSPGKVIIWKDVLEKMSKKMEQWDSRFLNFAGRLTLIKTSLQSLLVYYMSLCRIPKTVLKNIIKLLSNFLWRNSSSKNRPIHWVKWKKLCMELRAGGLGIRDIEAMNIALLSKWVWRLKTETGSLWAEVIGAKYLKQENINADYSLITLPDYTSKLWTDIWESAVAFPWFSQNISLNLGTGNRALFWRTNWSGDGCLAVQFSDLYSLCTCKEATVQELKPESSNQHIWQITFRRQLRSWEELRLQNLMRVVNEHYVHSQIPDQWIWRRDSAGIYTVASAYELQMKHSRGEAEFEKSELARSWCSLFFTCEYADETWRCIYSWLGIPYIDKSLPLEHLIAYMKHVKKHSQEVWSSIWMAVIWHLWRDRNCVRFDEESLFDTVESIKVDIWSWIVANGRSHPTASISEWLRVPVQTMNIAMTSA